MYVKTSLGMKYVWTRWHFVNTLRNAKVRGEPQTWFHNRFESEENDVSNVNYIKAIEKHSNDIS